MTATSIRARAIAIVFGGSTLLPEATRLFKPFGVTVAQFNALHLLAASSEGLRPSGLTRSLVVDPSRVKYLLDELQKRDWVRRTNDPADRRPYRIRLMRKGTLLHEKVNALHQASLAEIARWIDATDANRAVNLLIQIQQAAVAAVDNIVMPTRVAS